ncbi:hypothetical protein LguiA_017213 [Lonicera macranthoides]
MLKRLNFKRTARAQRGDRAFPREEVLVIGLKARHDLHFNVWKRAVGYFRYPRTTFIMSRGICRCSIGHRNKNNNFGHLLVHNYDTNHKEFAFAVYSDETLADPVYEYLDLRLNLSPFIYGPCNGIFCLYNNVDSMALWNPATREFRPLP